MRLALVILFFVAVHFVIRFSLPANLDSRTDRDILARPQAGAPAPAAPSQIPPPVASADTVPPPADTDTADDTQAAAPVRSGETERPGEERTSVHTGDKPEDIQGGIQKELVRLACFTGKPERRWGPKSRSAVRRFIARAKPQGGGTPNEALLRTLRGYPVNYCKLCNPGRAACKIGGTPGKRSQGEPLAEEPAPVAALSYLPPWMIGQRLAKASDAVQTDASDLTEPRPSPAAMPRRRKTAKAVYRPRASRVWRRKRGFTAVSPSGWPRSY